MKTVNIMLRSEYYGAGKSWTALSFVNPTKGEPERLVYDGEGRDGNYRGEKDDPQHAAFKFDDWRDIYGSDFAKALVAVIEDVKAGKFPYNTLIFDNATIFQNELHGAVTDKKIAVLLVESLGIAQMHQNFIQYRWNPNDAGGFYHLMKSIIGSFLLLLRRNNIDVIVTSESKNVWDSYGKRDSKILGQTAKLWDPWFQMGDLLLVLSRLEGSRSNGTAKIVPYPTATLDTFSPKSSIPGIAPEFVFKDWKVFWDMVQKRQVPDAEDFARVEVAAAIEPDNAGLQSIVEAKVAIVKYAIDSGWAKNEADARNKLNAFAERHNLDPANALAEYQEWLDHIDEENNGA